MTEQNNLLFSNPEAICGLQSLQITNVQLTHNIQYHYHYQHITTTTTVPLRFTTNDYSDYSLLLLGKVTIKHNIKNN